MITHDRIMAVLAVTAVWLISGPAAAAAAEAAAGDEAKSAKAAPKAASETKTDAGRSGRKIAVFPLEGVNVDQRILEASSEILSSSLISAGFTVADWKAGFTRITGQDPDAPPPPPPMESQDIRTAPMPSELAGPAAGEEPSAAEAPLGEQGVVDHATPPPPPDGYRRVAVPARPMPVMPRAVYAPPPPPPSPSVMVLKMSTDLKAEIARELGCDYYMDGKLVLLGSKIRVTVEKHDLQGDAIEGKVMEGRSEDDLILIYERMAIAFSSDSNPDDTLTLDNATRAEALRDSNRFRLEKNFGASIGETFSFSEDMDHYTLIGFNGRLEMRDVLVDLIAGFGIAGGDDPKAHFTAGVGLGYYLTHSNISPYLGASFGIFAGSRVDGEERSSDDVGFDYDEDEDDVAVGFELCPVFGVEFMRHSSIRVHLDFKYSFSVVTDSRYGHGLVALIGINF